MDEFDDGLIDEYEAYKQTGQTKCRLLCTIACHKRAISKILNLNAFLTTCMAVFCNYILLNMLFWISIKI